MSQSHYKDRPIFNTNEPDSLIASTFMTENKKMPNEKFHSEHRVVIVKGNQQWSFEWDSGEELQTVKAITDFAKSPDIDFDWFDAAMVCHEMSKITSKAA